MCSIREQSMNGPPCPLHQAPGSLKPACTSLQSAPPPQASALPTCTRSSGDGGLLLVLRRCFTQAAHWPGCTLASWRTAGPHLCSASSRHTSSSCSSGEGGAQGPHGVGSRAKAPQLQAHMGHDTCLRATRHAGWLRRSVHPRESGSGQRSRTLSVLAISRQLQASARTSWHATWPSTRSSTSRPSVSISCAKGRQQNEAELWCLEPGIEWPTHGSSGSQKQQAASIGRHQHGCRAWNPAALGRGAQTVFA